MNDPSPQTVSSPSTINVFVRQLEELRIHQRRILWLCLLAVGVIVALWLYILQQPGFAVSLLEKVLLLLLPLALVVLIGSYAHRLMSDRLFHDQMLTVIAQQAKSMDLSVFADDKKRAALLQDIHYAINRADTQFQRLHKIFADSTDETHALLDEQLNALKSQAQKLEPLLQKFQANANTIAEEVQKSVIQRQHANRDVFLQSAQYIFRDLTSHALDICRHLDEEITDAEWRHYQAGERNIFARKLLKKPQPLLVKQLENRLQDDTDLRGFVQRYCQEFAHLLHTSEELDREGFLYALIMTSDVGKLYLLLQMAQGKTQL